MKKISKKKKLAVVVLTGALMFAGAGVAFAYFTSTGTGTGSGAVGTATNDITVVGTETTPVFPGGATGVVSFTASNAAANPERLSNIHLTVVTPDTLHSSCATVLNTDFSMADVPVAVGDGTLAAHASAVSLTESGTLVMHDTGVSQNACEGATLTLTFTTS
jgi:hypothetical protein